MTETEIKELKKAVLEHWKDTKSVVGDVVVGLSQQVSILRKELADEKFSSDDLSPSIPSIKTIKEEAWFAFIEQPISAFLNRISNMKASSVIPASQSIFSVFWP